MTTPICTLAASFAVMLALSSSALAQSGLPDLEIEDLVTIDAGQVYGASERLQPALEAPASVSFITAAEIARYGYRTLADILSAVRGMYVVNDRNYTVIGMRGFALPGDYNTRMLLLINGHRVNDNVFGQAEIGAEFGLDAAMFERVEIIRGPASSLYGDSAFFVVVNVITRDGASLAGGSITVEAGTLGTQLVRGTVGRRLANGVELALSATHEHSAGVERLYFSGIRHAEHQQWAGGGARWRRRQALLRPSGLQGLDPYRCVWTPAEGCADRFIRDVVQRAGASRAVRRSSHAG